MTPAITEIRARCSSCNRVVPSQPDAPPTPTIQPDYPFQCIAADYFTYRDFMPIHPGKYQPHSTWRETLTSREEALRNRHMRAAERLSEHTRPLPPLTIGDCVRIQNQTGPNPTN